VSVVLAEAAVCTVLVCIVARTTPLFQKPNVPGFPSPVEATTRTAE
jgi:hypothetical protein